MSEKRKAVDFEELKAEMEADKIEPGDWPTIAGGTCPETELPRWLGGLNLSSMDVRIWEFTDRCTIGNDGPSEQLERLERARLFGEGGDLNVRRDGSRFLWRYVGEEENAPKGDNLNWPGDETGLVYRRERTALLWGERKEGQTQWFDDRTAGAALTYPVDGAPARVQVRYYEYTQAGRTLAVWLRGLEAYND